MEVIKDRIEASFGDLKSFRCEEQRWEGLREYETYWDTDDLHDESKRLIKLNSAVNVITGLRVNLCAANVR